VREIIKRSTVLDLQRKTPSGAGGAAPPGGPHIDDVLYRRGKVRVSDDGARHSRALLLVVVDRHPGDDGWRRRCDSRRRRRARAAHCSRASSARVLSLPRRPPSQR
jgi:hypothetical protein